MQKVGLYTHICIRSVIGTGGHSGDGITFVVCSLYEFSKIPDDSVCFSPDFLYAIRGLGAFAILVIRTG